MEGEKNMKAGIETGRRKLGSCGVTWWREIGLGSAKIFYINRSENKQHRVGACNVGFKHLAVFTNSSM